MNQYQLDQLEQAHRELEDNDLYSTQDYGLFVLGVNTRKIKRRIVDAMYRSLRDFGRWAPVYPALVRERDGKLEVIDGQHRILAAKKLGLPVLYKITKSAVTAGQLHPTRRTWTLPDYVAKFRGRGNVHYDQLDEFAQQYSLSLTKAANMLCPRTSANGAVALTRIRNGSFVCRNVKQAQDQAELEAEKRAKDLADERAERRARKRLGWAT
jgi:hypothetical protein